MLKIVLAGCGAMADTWIETILERSDTAIVALVSRTTASAQAKKERYSLAATVYTDLAEAIRQTGANLLINTSIPETHRDLDITAMRLGCDVFSEKPMALTAAEMDDILRVSRQTGKRCFIMQNRRYLKAIRAYRDLIAAGRIGELTLLCADFYRGIDFGGFRNEMDDPLIMDMAIHTFDMARFITGSDAVRVYCRQLHVPGSCYRGMATAVCTFDMTDGAVFSYRGSWESPGAKTPWQSRWQALGSGGAAHWDGEASVCWETPSGSDPYGAFDTHTAPLNWPGREGHAGCIDEMFDALLTGRDSLTTAADNRKSMDMVLAAIESSKTGLPIDL